MKIMKHILYRLSVVLLVIFTYLTGYSNQNEGYQIKIKINNLKNEQVILGHYLSKSMYPDDTVQVNDQGIGVFKGKQALPQGLYLVFLPSTKYFEIIIGNDQHFEVETDTANFVKNLKIKGSEENQLFLDFQLYMLEKGKDMKALSEKHEAAETEGEKKKIREKIKVLTDERKEKIRKMKETHPDLFVGTFLNATLDVEVKEPPKDENGNVIDSTWTYWYYRNNYFNNFDIGDSRLLRTPLYEDKMMKYLNEVVPQIPDTLILEVDKIIDQTIADSALFRYVLITLFKHYGNSNIMGMDAVQVHIAKKYYIPMAWWSEEKYINELKERVAILEPLILGKPAPNIELRGIPADHFKKAENDTALKKYPHAGSFFNIYDVQADFTVLLFWEATCSHCKKAVPELYKIYQDTLKNMGVQVIAVSTLFGEDGKVKWTDFINKHKLYDWINAWNPYDYQYKITYDVRTTPQIFVLNKEKEIIGKRLDPNNVVELIDAYKKYKLR